MSGSSILATAIGESREWLDAPAIGAVSISRKNGTEIVVSGRRSVFAREQVTPQDLWHIGSCTKAMTATILARLVEQGLAAFDAKLGESLPTIASKMHPDFLETTLRDVLTHSAGIQRDPPRGTFAALRRSGGSAEAQRLFLATEALRVKPQPDTGYSNLGYIVIGAIIEHLTGSSWEVALASQGMAPLGATKYGFGPPGEIGALDQPRGHRRIKGAWRVETVARTADNPLAYGPAGRVHIALADWARFLRVHLNAEPPSYLKPSTLSALHRPAPNGFAMGWMAERDDRTGEARLRHSGSNTAWFAQTVLLPQRGVGVAIVCNAYDPKIEESIDWLTNSILVAGPSDDDAPP